MKKQLLFMMSVGLLGGLLTSGTKVSLAKTKYNRLPLNFVKEANMFTNHFYRVNKKIKVNIYYSAKSDSRTIKKTLALPKGTVIASRYQSWQPNHVQARYHIATDISYNLKRKTATNAVYGNGDLKFDFKLPTSKVTRIKRPNYALPYGNGTLLTGGLKAIAALPNRQSNALKITSDGWLEYYRYNVLNYPNPKADLDDKISTVSYATKPESAIKINKSIKKGSNVYLYFSKKMAGVNQKKVRTSGNYKYRLTVHNNHTPVSYEDTAYGNDQAASSIYTIGGQPFYTVIAQGGD